jgi:hypothetical protein
MIAAKVGGVESEQTPRSSFIHAVIHQSGQQQSRHQGPAQINTMHTLL